VGELLSLIRTNFQRVRQLMKHIGHLAGTDIEPDEQTELLDATIKQRGVLAAAVPGGLFFQRILHFFKRASCPQHSSS